ncbi:Aspartate 1-decarboxylase [Frankliniella fusca]|uniref:Aspartate 1-decarboxylase n=1 Tax=Frankliniella fusca TaxID=407009 RepID=A0AAE1GVS2_9NEOP|nr:Aspartate 1-decarboxylase [Frankliniella fusca]
MPCQRAVGGCEDRPFSAPFQATESGNLTRPTSNFLSRVVSISEVEEDQQDQTYPAIKWKNEAPAPCQQGQQPLRRSARQAAVSRQPTTHERKLAETLKAGTSKVAENMVPPRKRVKASKENSESEDDEEPHGKDEVVKRGRQDDSDSGQSTRDDLGRWMDGDDDLSSDFDAPKKKISKANQAKKVAALRKDRRTDDHSDSGEEFEKEAKKNLEGRKGAKSLSLNRENKKHAKKTQPELKFTAGASPEPSDSDPDDPDVVILNSDSDGNEVPAVEPFQTEESAEGNNEPFRVQPQSLPENYCTICFVDYVDTNVEEGVADLGTSYIGIFHYCNCCRFCYVCALRIFHSNDPTCPRCRKAIMFVTSQQFTEDLLKDDWN